MSSRLVVCASCDRHVFARDAKCPFCESSLARRIVAGVATASAGLALLGCPDKQVKPDTVAADAAPAASSSASSPASSSATAQGAVDAGGDADPFGGALDTSNIGMQDLSALSADGGLGYGGLRGLSGVYGPAATATRDGGVASALRGDVQLSPMTTSVPIVGADRVMASQRPRFRAAYNAGLDKDPTMAGTFSFTVHVAADGSVTSVDATGPGLSKAVIDNMKSILQRTQFEAPGKPSDLKGSVVCKKAS